MKVVITIVGKDRVGIIATVSQILADHNTNILNINQNIVEGYFNMVMIADMAEATFTVKDLSEILKKKGEEMGLDMRAQHEDIYKAMHQI